MSVTESKAKATAKTSKKSVKPAAAAALKAALDAAPVEMIPVSQLVKSPLNVRILPYLESSVRRMADSIESVGVLQNLVVHDLPAGVSGVAAGGRRLAALQLLVTEQRIDAGFPVAVKRVSEELASIISIIENDERENMHPAEQIIGFRTLSEQGKTPAQIGSKLNFSTKHVQRMLKLAGLAPELLTKLMEDDISLDQCKALALDDSHERQLQVWEQGVARFGGNSSPVHWLKSQITDNRLNVSGGNAFGFIGREAYVAAGGQIEEDLFSAQEGNGFADRLLVEKLAQEKLEALGAGIQQQEGWAWMEVRHSPVRRYGDDAQDFLLRSEPEGVMSDAEQAQLDELYDALNQTDNHDDENAFQQQIEDLEALAVNRAWTAEDRAECGVVLSLDGADLYVQRGVQRLEPKASEQESEDQAGTRTTGNNGSATITPEKKPVDTISLPLLTKMSSERTLAVQAALMQQPEKAVALLAWELCQHVFPVSRAYKDPFMIRMDVKHYSLTREAPSGEEGAAYVALMQEQTRLMALLPEGWEKDFTTFFALDGALLMSLMAFCTACSVDGVQTRSCSWHTTDSNLGALEQAIGFHLRDWWTPTKENYFMGLKHAQIIEAMTEAGCTGKAGDAAKMKKGDAADLAEFAVKGTRWVPGWLQAPKASADAELDTDTDNDAPAHAA